MFQLTTRTRIFLALAPVDFPLPQLPRHDPQAVVLRRPGLLVMHQAPLARPAAVVALAQPTAARVRAQSVLARV